MVDLEKRTLVRRPHIALSAGKRELSGDGEDSTEIHLSVVDDHGRVVTHAAGAVKVTTQRGRLSARGGIVNLAHGKATVTLTSANETVSKVWVSAAAVDRTFISGRLDVEFV